MNLEVARGGKKSVYNWGKLKLKDLGIVLFPLISIAIC